MRTAIILGIVLMTTAAFAQERGRGQPEAPWISYGEGRKLYDVAAGLRLGCPADDTAAKRQQLAQAASTFAAAQDPKVKDTFVKFAQDTQAWFDSHVGGIPGAGTWTELDAKYKEGAAVLASLPVAPPNYPSAEQVKAHVGAYTKAAELHPGIAKIAHAAGNSPCAGRAGDFANLAWKLGKAKESLGSAVTGTLASQESEFRSWLASKPNVAPAPPATYWEHAEWVTKQLDYLATANKLAKIAGELDKVAAIEPKAAALAKEIRAKLVETEGGAASLVAELRRIEMPPLPKDAARAKMVKAAAEGVHRTVLGTPVGPKKSSTEKWTEKVEVKRTSDKIWYKLVKFEREFFTTYYAWQPPPDKASLGDLPGLPASELCELWVQNFTRYKKGKPDKKWFPSQDWRTAYIPCANVARTSALKIK